MILGYAQAQQTPPATAPQTPAAPAAKPPAAKTGSSATTPKTGTSTTAKKPVVPLTLKTQKEKASYAIGMNIGKSMHKDSVNVDPAILLRGLKDGLNGTKPLLTDDEARAAMTTLQTELRKKQEEKMQVQGDANKKAGDAFLACKDEPPAALGVKEPFSDAGIMRPAIPVPEPLFE